MSRKSIKHAIVNAIDETDASLGRYEVQMIKWAQYIEKAIGSKDGYKRIAKAYTVEGSEIEKPEGCVKVLKVLYGNHEDRINSYYQSQERLLVNKTHEVMDGMKIIIGWSEAENYIVSELIWDEYGDKINFLNELKGREITIFYNKIDVDEEGYWIVQESHIKAITDYIIYMFAKKNLWKTLRSDKMIRSTELMNIDKLEAKYAKSIRNARAEDGNETPFEKIQY